MKSYFFLFTLIIIFFYGCSKDESEELDEFINDTETFVDERDGKKYKWVKIGDQEWMAENLAFDAGRGCWAYDNNESMVETYGRLYTWEAALDVCPDGWHLPSDDEWTQLENYLADNGYNFDGSTGGGRSKIAKSLAAEAHWAASTYTGAVGNDLSANNSSGFSALPGGYRGNIDSFNYAGNFGTWWSSTESNNLNAWYRYLYINYASVYRYNYGTKSHGLSVRCVRD